MATLCPGVKYGLSSQQNFGGNKDLIFVKLTDSALRAIEEYLKNQNKFSCHGPTIKFLGNEGQLSFPSVQHINNNNSNNGNPPPTSTTSFNFSMSSTADMEGPGGSFECLQQTAPVSPQAPRGGPQQQQVLLEALGSIPYKVRVHANDDVYEATRHRMTIAEENHKNKCTREIKPNQTDIGRKVKLKQSRASALPPIRNNGSSRDLPPSSQQQHQRDSPVATKQPSSLYNNNINSNNMNNHQSSSMPSSNNSILNSLNNSSSSQNNFSKFSNSSISSSSSNGLSNGGNGLLGSNHVSSSMRPQVNRPSVPDIAKRPIKERLIQLLALRPFKKVELHDRLKKEGVREKNGMTSILKQISFMKDNCYHLNRAMWNEVNEEWPFYTETERQMLKRRKPQNLTPPGSSDGGSSGSGQSPTSTHPGSPPPMITSTSTKRPGYYDNQDGLPTKRQRISHYRKPLSSSAEPMSTSSNNNNNSAFQNNSNSNNINNNSSSVSGNYNQQQQRSPLIVDNNMNQRRPVTDSRDASNMNPRSRESPNMFGNNHNNNTNHSNGTMMNGGNGYYNNSNYNHGNNNNHHGNLSNGYSNHGNGGAIATMSRNNRACDDDEREDVTLPNNNNNNFNNNNNNKRQRFNHNNNNNNNSDINGGSTNHYNNHNGNNSNSMSFGMKKTPSPPLVVTSDFNNGHQNPSGNRLNSSRNNSPSLVNGNNYSSRNNNSPPLNGNSARNNSPPLMSNINNSSKFSPSPLAKQQQQQQQQPQHQNSDDFNGTNNSHSSISSNINNNSKYQKRDVAMVTSSPYSALQERNNGGLASSSVNNNVNGKLKSLDNGLVNGSNSNNNNVKDARSNKYDSNKVTSSSSSLLLQQQQQQQQNRVARVSPDSQSDVLLQISANLDARPPPPMSPVANPGEDNGLLDDEPPEAYPDYLQEYTNIENSEQRRRYKADFNADYAEYKNLHRIVEKVSRRFADLEARLKQENAASPRFKEIKKQIVREYYENKKDLEQQKSKRRFQYLHDKLSHIKRLVSEYDQKRMKSAQAAATAQENQQPQTNNNNNRRRY